MAIKVHEELFWGTIKKGILPEKCFRRLQTHLRLFLCPQGPSRVTLEQNQGRYTAWKVLQKAPNPSEALLLPTRSIKSHFEAKSRKVYCLKSTSEGSNPSEALMLPTRSFKSHFEAKSRKVYCLKRASEGSKPIWGSFVAHKVLQESFWSKIKEGILPAKHFRRLQTHLRLFCCPQGPSRVTLEQN